MTAHLHPQAGADHARKTYLNVTARLGLLGLDSSVPDSVQELSQKTVAQTREAYDLSTRAFDASVATFATTFAACGERAAAFNRKIVDIARRNAESGFDLATSLSAAKNLAAMVELQSAYWRKQFDVLTAQAEEICALSTKVANDAAKPIKAHEGRATQSKLSSRAS
jgi:hypothetical protein